ncbi:hypothetical protein ACOME3_006111 [Neoechinorhynchus agilis]
MIDKSLSLLESITVDAERSKHSDLYEVNILDEFDAVWMTANSVNKTDIEEALKHLGIDFKGDGQVKITKTDRLENGSKTLNGSWGPKYFKVTKISYFASDEK